jgi:DNA-directed RNA polymerase subunit RPC12/RpoP
MVATVIGLLGIIGFFVLAALSKSLWTAAISVFLLLNCWRGLRHAQALLQMAKLPRRQGFACPSCRTAPLLGEKWKCAACGQAFDTFLTGAVCPNCAARYPTTMCGDCGKRYPMEEWADRTAPGAGVINGGLSGR